MPDFSRLESQFRAALPDLPAQLRQRIAQIPAGKAATYGQIAESLGDRIASRWIGDWLANSPAAAETAAHRVVRAGGELGLYHSGDTADKRRLLEAEGIAVVGGKVNLAECGFADFVGPAPLAELRRWQSDLAAQNRITDLGRTPALVAGLDVSYRGGEGAVAYVLFDYESRELVWSQIARQAVSFPYITSYLSYRELPLHLTVLAMAEQANRVADLVIVDGSGIMHPRRCGIAAMLAALTGLPTIGVTKKRLCGSYAGGELSAERFLDLHATEETGLAKLGAAILPNRKTQRPIFVSPGGNVGFAEAEEIVAHFLVGRRLPTPIAVADRLSRQAAGTSADQRR